MNITSTALAVTMLSSAFLLATQAAHAQGNSQENSQANPPPPSTATRPAAPDQTSLPNNGPPASTTQTTGQASPDPMVKQMNEKEKGKVEREGK